MYSNQSEIAQTVQGILHQHIPGYLFSVQQHRFQAGFHHPRERRVED